jgi:hypothetical protein
MILLQLFGGLGNQMFQYAFGRHLAIKHNTQLVLDLSYVQSKFPLKKWTTPMQYELHIFPIHATLKHNIFKSSILYPFAKLEYIIKSQMYEKNMYNLFENNFLFNESYLNVNENNIFVRGIFQTEKYFNSIEHIIREDFKFKAILDVQNLQHVHLIQNTNAVSIHIRRGDYVNIKKNAQKFLALDLEYYQKAIDVLATKIADPTFFIFSDDINWVKGNLKINFPKYYIKNNTAKNTSYIDMQLMSMCKHNIIANSTFSWWAAWLNTNQNKIVIAPKRWFQHLANDNLLPNTWVQL